MRGDSDDYGLHREVLEYFSTEASPLPEVTATGPAEAVVLRGGEKTVEIEAGVFARLWCNAFWASDPHDPNFKGVISAAGVNSLALAATRMGLLEVASNLRSRALHGGDAELMQGSHRWSPLVHAPNASSSIASPAPNAAGRERVFADVLDFFDRTSHAQQGA